MGDFIAPPHPLLFCKILPVKETGDQVPREVPKRLTELDATLTELLLEKGLLGELPEAYRLVPLPLDEPEVAQKALLWAHEAPNPEGWPLVYALFLGGRPLRLLLPGREISLTRP
jgi:hypothetical protein